MPDHHSVGATQVKEKRQWTVRASEFAKCTFNPIRSIVDSMKLEPHPDKHMIALSIGDPTIFGNLKPHDAIIEAVQNALHKMKFNGYAPTVGYLEARSAVAEYYTTADTIVSPNDVILCSGCSHALDLCISALASRGQNVLMPRPGFSIYRTLGAGYGINSKFYNLKPEAGWEVDLVHLESLIDKNTVAIIVNNPSNPCGSVYNKQHLLDILQIAERHCLPIIADEIYDFFVFKGEEFHPLASLSQNVPILSCSGLTKRFLVPGWRMGWILIHDRNNVLNVEVRGALQSLSQRIIGSNTLVQGALPDILRNTPKSFFDETIATVQENAEIAFEKLQLCPGLHPVKPQGAMYMMIGIEMRRYPEFVTEFQFVERLVSEQSVFCLPGKCFDYPDYFRIVLTIPKEQLLIAMDRIMEFCCDHHIEEKNAGQHIVEVNGEQVHIDHTIPHSFCGGMAKT
ncbi:tyrosine aminotransferase [Folsomia candida]|uniref:Tyrosine aminotransferase n=1 Tax=Folsomia candida TaxID=158441 RepID=A0A226F6P6_FOLCA|nr:tyrosine aminotransferase [Folsomia candida]OXA65128.1 Tyrosine aminotransferase [Folsomia candida]